MPLETTLNGFPKGLNTKKQADKISDDELRQADNIDIDADGIVTRRKGYTQRVAGEAHSVWSTPDENECFFVIGNSLYRLNADFSTVALRSDLQIGMPMSFDYVNGTVFYSNGIVHGCIIDGADTTWGPNNPQGVPTAVATVGALDAGKYQFLVTFQDNDGRESGTGLTGSITLTENQGIALTHIPVGGSDIATVNIYISMANSTMLYRAGAVVNGTTTFTVTDSEVSIPLRTRLLGLIPKGQIVRYFSGRMLVAEGNTVWFSDAFGYHLCNLRKNFLLFPERVTMIAPTTNGFYVSADKTYYVAGTDMAALTQVEVAAYAAVEGTDTIVDGSLLGLEEPIEGNVPIWLGQRGICVGLPGGVMLNLTEDRVAMELTASRGAGLVKEEDGLAQFVGVAPRGEVSGIAASDVAVAEIIRNGIPI